MRRGFHEADGPRCGETPHTVRGWRWMITCEPPCRPHSTDEMARKAASPAGGPRAPPWRSRGGAG
eukprot:15092602-Alexandrium_andersonii.AAC.1